MTEAWFFLLNSPGVCTANKLFTDISVGVPGRRNDAAVLRFSKLYKSCRDNLAHRFFPTPDFHIIGDSAYPSLSWLLSPYKKPGGGRDNTDAEKLYNFKHSSTRTVIENAFGLLKGRWARL